ncbi:hypothetical protein RchiOBHm_Chr3g0496911 [Rosa chinensis]|uniref:Uncharacterized protein n=1 Tax=Rosa chinensis TaxID=74649 RepID=A0A2P6RHL0_ROSCH|nr:hypothetical protein RchiOBHm_Chr3g0496911 [Rosa chinensis]
MFLSETLSMSVSFAFLIKSPSGVLPTTREKKKVFKELIKTRMTADDLDNYSEALRTPLKSLLLEELEFLANEGGGEAPLEGSIPDITSSTEHYLALQKTY